MTPKDVLSTKAVADDLWKGERLREACSAFIGTYSQVPPIFSAIKKDGRSLMSRARAGEVFEPDPRVVTCHDIRLVDVDSETQCFTVDIDCAKGFYVRSLARDLARFVGEQGHLRALRRTRSGHFEISRAKSPEDIGPHDVLPPQEAVDPDVLRMQLDLEQAAHVRNGRPIPRRDEDRDHARALLTDGDGLLMAMAIASEDGRQWKVARGFNLKAATQ